MDYTAWKFWLDVAQVLVTAAIGIYVWLGNRNRVTNERIQTLEDDVDERLDSHGNRLTRIEAKQETAPSRADVGRIHARIDGVDKAVSSLDGKFERVANTLDLIHSYLLNGKQK